jgi:DNA-binding beta-propeller fold protein YncE
VKFSPDGKFIKAWGKKGSAPGEFDTPHTLAMDSQGRLFVGDRQNNRIQIFDQDGNFIDRLFQFSRPSGVFIDAGDTIYVADSESESVSKNHTAGNAGSESARSPTDGWQHSFPTRRRGDDHQFRRGRRGRQVGQHLWRGSRL